MAEIDLFNDPFQPRERRTQMPALDWKYTAGKRRTSSPYARYNVPGYRNAQQPDSYEMPTSPTGTWYGGVTGRAANPFETDDQATYGRMQTGLQTPWIPPATRTAQGQSSQQGAYQPVPNDDYQTWFMAQTNGRAPTPAELVAMEPELAKYGIKVQRNAEGVAGKIVLPNGQVVDVIEGAGRGGVRWQWLTGPGGGEFSDPLTAQYESLAKQRIDQLFNPLPEGPDTLSMADWMRKRSAELEANPGYSAGDRELLRTGYSDPMAAQREAAKQQVRERMAAQGLQGGLVERAMQEVDRNFDSMLAANNRQLGQSEIQRKDQNLNTVTELRQNLAIAEQARQAFQEGRYREAIALSDQLARLPERRIQLANQTLSGGQSPSDLFSQWMNFGQAGDQANWMRNQQNSQFWQSIFSFLAPILSGRR